MLKIIIERLCFLNVNDVVRLMRNILLILMALLWMPVTAHCQIEAASGAQVFQCQSLFNGSSPMNTHCSDENCCAVEKALFGVSESSPLIIVPEYVCFAPLLLDELDIVPSASHQVGFVTTAPPDLIQPRHFIYRTALAARAPSIAS